MAEAEIPAPAETVDPEAFRDEDDALRPEFVALVSAAITAANRDRLAALVEDLHEADLGELIEALEHDERPRLIALLGRNFDYAALTEVDDAVREDILEEISNADIAEGVRDLESDDAVYILEDLAEEDQEEVLARIPALERVTLERSLDYPEESAGRRMQADLIAVPPFWTVGQTIDFMRHTEDLPEQFYRIFVVDPGQRIVGAVALDRMLRAKRPVKIDAIMENVEHIAHVDDDQEDVADAFRRYNLVSIPVVDADKRLVGVLTFDDIVDVIDQEADEDMRALAGVKADEEISDPVFRISRGRFTWLFANMITAFIASSVLKEFQGQIEKMVALAVLAPIVASMGGNAGTQAMTVTVRAIAEREIHAKNFLKVILREAAVGCINGLAFAMIAGSLAALWFRTFDLGIVIAVAMQCVMIAAALAGVVVPLTLHRLGADPAVSSGPFVTTVTDIVAFLTFLGTATLWFGLA